MKSIVTTAGAILLAVLAVALLLRKSGPAGVSGMVSSAGPCPEYVPDIEAVRPPLLLGYLQGIGKQAVPTRIGSWGSGLKSGFILMISKNPMTNQPEVRLVLDEPAGTPELLEVQYTIPERFLKSIQSNPDPSGKFDGVSIQISAHGGATESDLFLETNPIAIPNHRAWLSRSLRLPKGTREIDFRLIGVPPAYDLFDDQCFISLPQMRFHAEKSQSTHGKS